MAIKTEGVQETLLSVRGKTAGEVFKLSASIIFAAVVEVRAEKVRSEVRPTEAVYMDRKVRGHASKHVVGAKLQGLENWPPGTRKIRDLLQLFCKVMQTAICITDTEARCTRPPFINQILCRF